MHIKTIEGTQNTFKKKHIFKSIFKKGKQTLNKLDSHITSIAKLRETRRQLGGKCFPAKSQHRPSFIETTRKHNTSCAFWTWLCAEDAFHQLHLSQVLLRTLLHTGCRGENYLIIFKTDSIILRTFITPINCQDPQDVELHLGKPPLEGSQPTPPSRTNNLCKYLAHIIWMQK